MEASSHAEHRPGVAAEHAITEPQTGTQAIGRAVMLLRLIARVGAPGARLADLSRQAELPHPTLHRILRCLVAERLVVQDRVTRRYQLGPMNFELGLATLHKTEFQRSFRPHLEHLAAATGDTAYLLVRSGVDFVCLDRVEGSYPIRAVMLHVGGRRPLFLGAGGLALLAQLDDAAVEAVLRVSAREMAQHRGLGPEQMRAAIARTRCRGYGMAKDNAHLGVASLAMAIPGEDGPAHFAVSLAMVSERLDAAHERHACALLRSELRKAAALGAG